MKFLAGAAAMLALTITPPQGAAAQNVPDAEYLAAYRDYWSQLQNEFRLAGNDCAGIAARLDGWVERNRDDIDSLVVRSEGLVDRMTENQIAALLPIQEPLLLLVVEVSARCIAVPAFRRAMGPVNLVIGMGS